MSFTACLLPQDDQIVEGLGTDLPPKRNRPPRIIDSQLQPPNPEKTVMAGDGCPPIVFSAVVVDDDVNDPIYVRWYVDGNINGLEEKLAPTGSPSRVGPSRTLQLNGGPPLDSPGGHLVELLVADGTLVNREPEPRPTSFTLPDGGTQQDVNYSDRVSWLINVKYQACP